MTKNNSPVNEPTNETESFFSNEDEISVPSEMPPTDNEDSMDNENLEFADEESSAVPLPLSEETDTDVETNIVHNNKKVTGLWSIDQNKNVFANIAGTGFKKLANHSESGIVALNMLASHAKSENSKVNYREEKDGMIHEIYVW